MAKRAIEIAKLHNNNYSSTSALLEKIIRQKRKIE